MFTPLVWFVSQYADRLDADGLLEIVRQELFAWSAGRDDSVSLT